MKVTRKQILLYILFIALLLFAYFFILQVTKYVDSKVTRVDQKSNSNSTKITFLDIGQGDATFIEFSNKQQILIDCAKDSRILEALGRAMPFYDRNIDFLVITHPDLDHYGGCIDVLQRFQINTIVYTDASKDNQFFDAFTQEIKNERQHGAIYTTIDKEQIWNIASTTIHFLFPNAPLETTKMEGNNTSIIIKLTQGDQDILLTGDAEKELESYLIKMYGTLLDVEVLKVGHHGSDTSSIQPFLEATSPDFAIISAGSENKYGHPTPRVLKRLQNMGAQIWRTDTQGDIIATINEQSINVKNRPTN